MVEMELLLNREYANIRKAVLCVGSGYQPWRLKELVEHTRLDTLILTGNLSEKQAKKMMEPLEIFARAGKLRLPSVFKFCPIDAVECPEGEFALLCETLDETGDILPLFGLKPTYFVGKIVEGGLSAFYLWEQLRAFSKHVQIVTTRPEGEEQVLDWEKDPENDIELSVIFPMYNVAKYLDQCIQSVTAWKADYIEFLFVNDGSPDNSREIVLEYAKNDPRIKLLDKPNGGCASARQWGLDRAKGRYVGFIDPDDYVEESMYRKLLRAAMVGSYDISYGGYYEYYENNGQIRAVDDVLGWPYNLGVTDPAKIQELITFCRVAIWRGIYKMSMLKQSKIHFYTEIRRFDDLPFKIETFAAARSVIAVNEPLYYYRLARPGQDMAADDERLYVHFPIFAHLNESVAGKKDPHVTDYLQMAKIQTHRFAVEKIQPQYVKEYVRQAREDLATTGEFRRTYSLAKEMLGKRSALLYRAIMKNNMALIKWLKRKA